MTRGPAEVLTAASLLAMPRLARLTVAQVNSTAAVVMTARREMARRVLMLLTVPVTSLSAGMIPPRRPGL